MSRNIILALVILGLFAFSFALGNQNSAGGNQNSAGNQGEWKPGNKII